MVTDWFGTMGTERVAVGLDDLQTMVAQDVAGSARRTAFCSG
jgi:hypothetical protein